MATPRKRPGRIDRVIGLKTAQIHDLQAQVEALKAHDLERTRAMAEMEARAVTAEERLKYLELRMAAKS